MNLNVKNKTLKLSEGNVEEYLYDFRGEIISQYKKRLFIKKKLH